MMRTLAATLFVLAVLPALCAAQETAGWFVFEPKEDFSPSVIDATGWLDAPAGKHGFVLDKGDGFVFEDKVPVKFWGVNICNERVAPTKESADIWAQKLAKYSVNVVRFHKWTHIGEAVKKDSTSIDLDPQFMDRFDYFCNELRKRGIYYSWSHIYSHEIAPADAPLLLAYDEVKQFGDTSGMVNFAPDLQDLSIGLTENMLTHRNPYSGLTYAKDPALCYIEFQNEDDLFFNTKGRVDKAPTYRKLFDKQFSDWLKAKYGTQEALAAAWGPGGFDKDEYQKGVVESLDAGNIYPVAHPWWYGPDGLRNKAAQRQRLLDTARFLYETQNKFYSRFAGSIRELGYRGSLVGSCWQAGSGISHFYNMNSDYQIGAIDRHNYFANVGHRLAVGRVSQAAMVSKPGSGLLSTGMQQAVGRPFQLSEWISCIPNEWVAEGPPLIAVYGFGLQGWDGSHEFASNYDHFTPGIEAPWVYNADSPTQMGQYPALARMIYRGDVKEGTPVAVRKVSLAGLAKGEVGFEETVAQEGDVKSITGATPSEALAVGRVLVQFTDQPEASQSTDLAPFWDQQAKVVRSNTGQLTWNYAGKGYFTVNTPGTQAVVGFAQGAKLDLGDVTLQTNTPFVSLFVTSLDPQKPIAQASSLLVTAVARARNTGMQFNADATQVTQHRQAAHHAGAGGRDHHGARPRPGQGDSPRPCRPPHNHRRARPGAGQRRHLPHRRRLQDPLLRSDVLSRPAAPTWAAWASASGRRTRPSGRAGCPRCPAAGPRGPGAGRTPTPRRSAPWTAARSWRRARARGPSPGSPPGRRWRAPRSRGPWMFSPSVSMISQSVPPLRRTRNRGLASPNGSELDDAVRADQTIVRNAQVPGAVGGAEAKDAIGVLPHGQGLVVLRLAEDQVLGAVVNLSDHPLGGRLVVEVVGQVEVVAAIVAQVQEAELQPRELADLAGVNHGLRHAGGLAEAALVVERELHAALLADARHALAVAPGGGHGLFAVDGLDARLGARDRHLRVQMGPGGDADDVQPLLRQHLAVVRVGLGDAELLGEDAGVLFLQVRAGDHAAVAELPVAKRVLGVHAELRLAVLEAAHSGPDEADAILRH